MNPYREIVAHLDTIDLESEHSGNARIVTALRIAVDALAGIDGGIDGCDSAEEEGSRVDWSREAHEAQDKADEALRKIAGLDWPQLPD